MNTIQKFLAFSFFLQTALFSGEIRLVDRIAVEPPVVTLGEIAVIDVENRDVRERLIQLEVIEAPRMGMPRTISGYKVKSILQQAGMGDILVRGVQTTVHLQTREIGLEELKERVEKWVLAQATEDQEMSVNVLRLPHTWEIPAGNGVQIEIDSPRDQLVGNLTLTMRAVAEGQVLSTQRAYVHVTLYEMAPVVVRPIRRGEKITADHVEIQRTEMGRSSGMEVVDLKDMIGMAAKRQMPVGYVPKMTDFERPILIERGSPASIVVDNGSVRMKVTGAIALESGREGDFIQFSNPMNGKETLRARVRQPGMAVIKIQ